MKYLVFGFAVVLCVFCALIDARYLYKDRGELGKQFWGKNHTVMDGDNLTLQCGSEIKKDHPKYKKDLHYWFWVVADRHLGTRKFPDATLLRKDVKRNVVRRRPYGFRTVPENIPGTIDMKLINVNRYATGKYVCAVATIISKKPKINYVEGTFQNVVVKCKPRIESTMKTKIQLAAGDKLTVDCMSSGYPVPVIKWRRVDGRPLPVRTIIHSKGLLSIHDVGQLDRGGYECISSNIYGNDTRIFSVNMTVRARIMTMEKSYATIKSDGAVKCVAVGIPRPKFSWKWYEDGVYDEHKLSSEDGQFGRFKVKTEHYFENSTSYLMIKNVRSVDFREYECRLKDGDTQKIRLVGYSKPDRPIIQTVVSSSTSITLSWKVGDNDGGRPVTSIIIEYLPYNGTEWQSDKISADLRARHTIYKLKSNTQYTLRVVAVNEIGPSQPSSNHLQKTDFNTEVVTPSLNNRDSIKIKEKEPLNMMVMVAGVAGGFLVLIIAIVIMCILMRNIQRNSAKKAAENAQRMAKNAKDDTTALINFSPHVGDRSSTTIGCGDILHLTPSTTSNRWEFSRERLTLQNVLGSGAFGIVMKAEAEGINGDNPGSTPVAVKFVKENESASAKKDLIAELELLKLIEPHKNVINLLGCCTRSEPLMVIVEFCAYGDLQSFLRASRGIRDQYNLDCYKRPSSRLTSNELLMFGTQIAKGMAHLASLKVIHRDLAARNILVDENKVCKVSDFGFARDIYVEDHYTRKTAGGRFPIKWMAIESLLDGISTTKSDVWSFAIVLWEIITLGASPYPGMNSQEVVSFLQNGMRMDKPKHCSDELYNLLLDCWQVPTLRRPNFEMLARYLDRMCNDEFEYINMRTYDDHLYINFDGNTVSEGSKSGSLMKQDTFGSKDNSEESAGEKDSN
ncbi:fibroblast growth factor receptor 4-like isoform X1 [Paramuricea clavata]|uniref:receptor protein-tyrosine kinase n=1 Tax=Paramuricea clavata TaxID=317549 RepID=A0A7D9HH55_PARCT|nr:fibroblast growth factor receptor 4-like isoform X1 [Paramuricea clavata]